MRRLVLTMILAVATVAILMAPGAATADEIRLSEDKPTYYTVIKGDTLWDISGRFFEDPFKWPKLWKWNPYIHNPHLIYPGDLLKITPNGIERVEAPERTEEGLPMVKLAELGYVEREEAVGPKVAIYSAPHTKKRGMITKEELEVSAAIAASKDTGIMMMAQGDEVFISYKDPSKLSPGETYTLFVVSENIYHPATGDFLGYLTEDVGTIVVKGKAGGGSKDNDVFVGTIETSSREIAAGTLLKPYKVVPTEIEIVATTAKVNGHVVSGFENLNELAQTNLIFMDKGKKDGLRIGNLLQIYRERPVVDDPLKEKRKVRLPLEDVAVVVITDVKETTSHGIIITNSKEVGRGDMVRSMGPLD